MICEMFSAQMKARRKYHPTEMYSKLYPERVEARMSSELKKAHRHAEKERRRSEGDEQTADELDSEEDFEMAEADATYRHENTRKNTKSAGVGRSLWMKTWRRVVAELYASETEEVKAEIAQKLKDQEKQREREQEENKDCRTPDQYQG